ncbi:MAG: tetratricopeptide repeat protein [Candidatus Wallbacteria bacterium]
MLSNDNEKKVKALLNDSIKAVKEKRLAEAISGFKQICVNYPDSNLADNAHYNLGMVYEMKHDYSKAFIEYKTILEQYPDSDAALFAKDKIEELNQNLDPAAVDFAIGQNFYIQHEYKEAEKIFVALIKNYPGSNLIDNAMFYIGMIKKSTRNFNEARTVFEEIQKKYPNSDAAELIPEILSSF